MIRIIGNGISAIICAICLDKLQLDYEIYGSGTYCPPPLLFLKNDQYNLFSDYEKKIVKVGYIKNGQIYDELTPELKSQYLAKQGRAVTSSSVSDGISSYEAIDLTEVYNRFDKSKIIDKKVSLDEFEEDDIILNTIFPYESKEPNYLYIRKEKTDLKGYTYLYDCDDNNVKRITENFIEYISPVENSIKIKNYYDEPNIPVKDNTIYISRNASQTQLKVEDIISYLFTASLDKIEKIRELQGIFDELHDDTVAELIDGTYTGQLLSVGIKTSAKGNDYVQMEFKVNGYENIIKRMMIGERFRANENRIIDLARQFGFVTLELSEAIVFLNKVHFYADLRISNTDKEFYDVKVAKVRNSE